MDPKCVSHVVWDGYWGRAFFHCSYSKSPRGLRKRLPSPVSILFLTATNLGPTYPSPKPTLTLTSHLGQNVGLREGSVGSFPEKYNYSESFGYSLLLNKRRPHFQFFCKVCLVTFEQCFWPHSGLNAMSLLLSNCY